MVFKRIGVTCDHAGRELKTLVYDFLQTASVEVTDYGVDSNSDNAVDYPDFAGFLAADISARKIDGGVAICGTGIGVALAANKYPGVRATTVWDEYTARKCREHNDSNILCLGARTINLHRAIDLVKIWIETEFKDGRHQLRLDKIANIEKQNFQPRLEG